MYDSGAATSRRSFTACSMSDCDDRPDADPKVWFLMSCQSELIQKPNVYLPGIVFNCVLQMNLKHSGKLIF